MRVCGVDATSRLLEHLDDVRGARREVREGNRLLIEEPGRVIIQEGGQTTIRHNDADRFRWQAQDVHIERRGAETVTVFERPDGSRIYTMTDENGRLLRRYRRLPDGREIIIIDNRYSGPPRPFGCFVDLPPPVIRSPRERYIVDAFSQQFGVPPENLTTQGYGEQYLKISTTGTERANRRVTVRRITPLLTGENQATPLAPQ